MARRYYLEDIALDEAYQRFEAALARAGVQQPLEGERVRLSEGLGRVTALPIWANLSSPHYHAAAMDGVAVRASETAGATESTPKRLQTDQQAIWVDTGDPLPPGMDAVIMAEHLQQIDEQTIEIRAAAAPWHHVRTLGEDIVATELVLPEHHLLRPVDLGAVAAAGHAFIDVRRRPRVTIIPTGTELVSVDDVERIQPGNIIEFNSLMLSSSIQEWGGIVERHAPVPDRRELLREAIVTALAGSDIVVVNAGSSAGSEDYTAAVLAELGEVVVHGVAIRPGHPVILAVVGNKPVFGLPGYPVSTALTADLFLRPLVYRMQGQVAPLRPTMQATISRKLLSPMGEDEFVRVTLGQVDGQTIATPLARGAGVVTSLMRADGLVRIPRFLEGVHSGAEVTVDLFCDPTDVAHSIVATGSHDLALDLLASFIRRSAPNTRLVSANVGSLGGLMTIKRNTAHIAGSHLLDETTGEYNWPFIDRLLPNEDILVVNLAYREQGLLVAPGNPQNLRELRDLTQQGVKLVNRQKGSGTRALLDFHLQQHDILPEQIAGYDHEEFTHMAVAAAVLSRVGTVGLGILAAARALNLEFIPLFHERYDLVVPCRHWQSELLSPLRETLASPQYQQAVTGLGGYDVRRMGTIMERGATD